MTMPEKLWCRNDETEPCGYFASPANKANEASLVEYTRADIAESRIKALENAIRFIAASSADGDPYEILQEVNFEINTAMKLLEPKT